MFISKVHESLNNSLRSGDRVKDFFLGELACLPYLLGVTPFLIQQKKKRQSRGHKLVEEGSFHCFTTSLKTLLPLLLTEKVKTQTKRCARMVPLGAWQWGSLSGHYEISWFFRIIWFFRTNLSHPTHPQGNLF